MALTELYVNPAIAGDSGTGTVGDPYGDLQYCLTSAVFDTTNGTRINIKSGTAEILAATLNLATNFIAAGGPSGTAPLVFQGYTSAAGDGSWSAQTGIGGIDGNNKAIFPSGLDYTTLRHMELFGRAGAGYAMLAELDDYCAIIECEIHTHSGTSYMVYIDTGSVVERCHFHTLSANTDAIYTGFGGGAVDVDDCYFNLSQGNAISLRGMCKAKNNIIRLSGAATGINLGSTDAKAIGNSIWSNAGTGKGIRGTGPFCSVINNVVEGFSGAGGVGIEKTSGVLQRYGGNHCYNNTANYNVSVTNIVDLGDNEDLSGSSPFTNASSQNFTPLDVGNMKEKAWPPSIESGDAILTADLYRWKGAVEPTGGGGGGMLVHPGTNGGARG